MAIIKATVRSESNYDSISYQEFGCVSNDFSYWENIGGIYGTAFQCLNDSGLPVSAHIRYMTARDIAYKTKKPVTFLFCDYK